MTYIVNNTVEITKNKCNECNVIINESKDEEKSSFQSQFIDALW